MESRSEMRNVWHGLRSTILTGVLAVIVYYLLYSWLTTTIWGSITLFPFMGERIIAGIGALVIIWWRRPTGINWQTRQYKIFSDNIYTSFLGDFWKFIRTFCYCVLFIFGFIILAQPYYPFFFDKTHPRPDNEVSKILVENGYCGDNKTYVVGSQPCTETTRGMVGVDVIAGGFEYTVYGVTDKNILDQIRQVYLTTFLKTPRLKHIIIYFDPSPPAQAQSKFKNTFLEMRK